MENKVYVVLFLDGDQHVAAVRTLAYEPLGPTVEHWAEQELARMRAPFPELIARGGKSVAEAFLVYGSDIERI